MRSLQQSLLQHDFALLQVIADHWGVDLTGLSQRGAAEQLANATLAADLPAEFADLPAGEQAALHLLLKAGGRSLADPFFRQFGAIRLFGPGRLAREQPWTALRGPAEALWYRGLLFRAFEQTELGSQEFVYLPHDVRAALPLPAGAASTMQPQLVPAEQSQTIVRRPAAAGLVDDCCTLLALAQRDSIPAHPQLDMPGNALLPFMCYKERARLRMIWSLALEAELLNANSDVVRPHPKIARDWLQAPHPEQAATLAQTWLDGKRWNDLWQVPSLHPEPTGWQNDPRPPRQLLLNILSGLDTQTWWQLDSLPAAVQATTPDFQRTAGEYDAWYLRDEDTGEYLLGFVHWERVEGVLLCFLVTGPLYWLGLVELGEDVDGTVVAFRPSPAGRTFAQLKSFPYPPGPAEARIRVHADATISVSASVNRLTRFQVARLTDWEPLAARETRYRYRLSPRSLDRARQSGISISRALAFLASRSGQPLPDSVKKAVESWQKDGVQIRLRQVNLLQVQEAAVLDQLCAAPNVRPLLGPAIGPLAVVVRTADWARLVSAIAELGLLSEVET